MNLALFVAGAKGYNFLQCLSETMPIDFVCSYQSKGSRCDSYSNIVNLCKLKSIPFSDRENLQTGNFQAAQIVMIAGWQFLMNEIDDRFVVLHDSLLPKFRGFSPTVVSLIVGERQIGVTAFRPSPGVDTGDIFDQEAIGVSYPVTIKEAYEKLGHAYACLAQRLVAAAEKNELVARAQDHGDATYAVWRDEADYEIDWTSSATEIRRFVDALGWPYMGAKTRYQGAEIRIEHVEEDADLSFAIRQPGKLWSIDPASGEPLVICGVGMIRIKKAVSASDQRVQFKSLRQRLGR